MRTNLIALLLAAQAVAEPVAGRLVPHSHAMLEALVSPLAEPKLGIVAPTLLQGAQADGRRVSNIHANETAADSSIPAAKWEIVASTPSLDTQMNTDPAAERAKATAASPLTAPMMEVVVPMRPCEDLLSVDLRDVTSNANSVVKTAVEEVVNGITYCSIQGTLGSSANFQVLLPVATWTQRYMQTGCGGLCGKLSIQVGAAAGSAEVANGNFALASSDMSGGMDGSFGLDRERRIDFAYRAMHLTAVAAKKLITVYYGQQTRYSYFSGCSDGGREAMMEAIRYPTDFDGIIAGAPAMLFLFQNTLHHGWQAVANTDRDGSAVLLSSRLPILHEAVLAQCDALDGSADGLLSDPRLCDFDPSTIQCAADVVDTSNCLTSHEVETVAKLYRGPVDSTTGAHLTVGEAQFGSELAWKGVFVPESPKGRRMSPFVSMSVLKCLAFEQNPPADYTLQDLEFSSSTIDLLRPRHPLFDAISPDLSAFKNAGGKLMLWHGWSDEHIPPVGTIAYHEALQNHMGADAVSEFERFYLLPGVYHCGGGEGPSSVDFVTPMLNWVEAGIAPNAITASSDERSAVKRSRPLFPHPHVAKYSGTGDTNAASSYVQSEPLYTKLTAPWAGEDFFQPYNPIEG